MSEFFQFAGEHPFLTGFLALVIASIPQSIIKALRGPRPIHLQTKSFDDE